VNTFDHTGVVVSAADDVNCLADPIVNGVLTAPCSKSTEIRQPNAYCASVVLRVLKPKKSIHPII
jgi:hypothetical protein